MTRTGIVWDSSFTDYNFGDEHPMNPVRLDLTARLCREFGLFDHPDVTLINPDVPADEVLLSVHTPEYVEAVRHASLNPESAQRRFGLGTEDDPAFAGIHESSARIVAGTLAVTKGVWEGDYRHGVNFTGGCTTRCRRWLRGSASTTMRPLPSSGCWTMGRLGSPMWTSTRTTATGWSGCSGTSRGC